MISSIRPYSFASAADRKWSRSVSRSITSMGLPVFAARISFRLRLMRRICSA